MSHIKKTSFIKILALTLGVTLVATACDDTKASSKASVGASSVASSLTSEASSKTSVTSSISSNQQVSSTVSNSSSSASSSSSVVSSSIAPTLTGITLNTENVKKDYIYGAALDLSGLVVTASYSNNVAAPVTGYTTNPANGTELKTVGESDVVVTYQSATASFKITVTRDLVGIELNTENVKKEYGYNEALDLTGLVVTAKYNDESTTVVTEYTSDPANGTALTNLGENTVTVTYNNKTASFKINVSKVLTGIELDTTSMKTAYHYGEKLSYAGLKIYAKYNDNSKEEINFNNCSASVNFGEELTQDIEITIFYNNFSAKINITVERGNAVIATENVKKEYYYGDSLDLTGLEAYYVYHDGSTINATLVSSTPANGAKLNKIGKQTVIVEFKDQFNRTINGSFDVNVRELEETSSIVTLPLDTEISFENNVANVNAIGTVGSNYHPNFKLTKNNVAADSMTIVNDALRVKKGDVIENTESLNGVTEFTVNGGNGSFDIFVGYDRDNMYKFLEAEPNGGSRIYSNVPNINYFKLVGTQEGNFHADIRGIEFKYTRDASNNPVPGTPKSIHTLTVNEGEYIKGTKTLVVEGNTVKVDGKTYTYTGVFYNGALFYADSETGLLVKYVNDTAVVVRDTLDNYSSLSGQYTKVIPATKVEMFVNGVKTAANTADTRVEMNVNSTFTFSATCDAVPSETPVITLVDETNPGEVDPYVGTYTLKSTVTVHDIYGGIDDFELTVKPIQVIKQEGKYYAVYEDVATGPYEGTKDVFTATVSNNKIMFGDNNLDITLNLEDKQLEFTYVDDDGYVYCQGEIGYNFVSSANRTAEYVNGKVVALAAGNFYMSAKASNGLEAKYYVKVNAYVPATLTVEATAEVEVGKTYQINASVNADATDKTILFESADKTIATVDENGLVTGVKAGTTTITVISNDDEKTVAITVKAGAATIVTTTYSFTDENGDDHTFVFVEGTSLTIDGTYTFTYSNGTYVYDEDNEIMVELRVSGNNGYLTVIDENMVVFGYIGGPIYVIDLDNELMLDFVSKTEETQGQGGQGGGQVTPQITGTYEFVDDYSVTHTIVITNDDATIDDVWVFNNENGNYVFQYDSDCYLTFTRDANGITMHFEDYSQSMASYGAAYLDNTTGDIELLVA